MMPFEYFYGSESEQFSFYRIPKILFKGKAFKGISVEAKILYGLMLDRMSLSVKNKWFDEENRVYIIYTLDDIIEDFGCARQKAAKLLGELDKEIGLIERKRQGLGRPNIIYVKNFVAGQEDTDQSESRKTERSEVWNSNLQKYENHTSRNMILEPQEVPKSYANYTDNNNTEWNDTEIISYPITQQSAVLFPPVMQQPKDEIRWTQQRQEYEEIIKENIDYDSIVDDYGAGWLNEIVTLMVDVVCTTETTIRINKQAYPREVVKSRFLKIDSSHIEYIYLSLKENTSKVRNIRAFLITTIYRAFETADNWFSAKVKYDMAHGGF